MVTKLNNEREKKIYMEGVVSGYISAINHVMYTCRLDKKTFKDIVKLSEKLTKKKGYKHEKK